MPTTTTAKAVTFATGLFVGLAIGTAGGGWIASEAIDTTAPPVTIANTGEPFDFATYTAIVTGVEPAEDDPAFDCRIHGNRICGPDNSQGVPAGTYRDSSATSWQEVMLP